MVESLLQKTPVDMLLTLGLLVGRWCDEDIDAWLWTSGDFVFFSDEEYGRCNKSDCTSSDDLFVTVVIQCGAFLGSKWKRFISKYKSGRF